MKMLGERTMAQVGRRLSGQLYVDRAGDVADTVFVAGSGRSGTTWVADILNARGDHRYLFEPFHRHKVREARAFRYRQYLRPDDLDPAFLDGATRIVTGQVRSLWVDQHNRSRRPGRRLVKEVRANLFLRWLHARFPEMPIVLLLRHPCAVAASRMKVDWAGGADLRGLLAQPQLVEDWLGPFAPALGEATDLFDRMIHFWCVENHVPLQQFRRGEIHLMFYETLCVEPEPEIRRLLDFLGRPFDPALAESASRPSSTSRTDSAIVSGESLVEAWRRHVTDEQVERATAILAAYGLDRVYGEGSMPLPASADGVVAS